MTTTSSIAGTSFQIRARTIAGLFKLRIGSLIMITALAGMVVTPGGDLGWTERMVLALSVLVASASAGAFNQGKKKKKKKEVKKKRQKY